MFNHVYVSCYTQLGLLKILGLHGPLQKVPLELYVFLLLNPSDID
jgi:hypothetical protein